MRDMKKILVIITFIFLVIFSFWLVLNNTEFTIKKTINYEKEGIPALGEYKDYSVGEAFELSSHLAQEIEDKGDYRIIELTNLGVKLPLPNGWNVIGDSLTPVLVSPNLEAQISLTFVDLTGEFSSFNDFTGKLPAGVRDSLPEENKNVSIESWDLPGEEFGLMVRGIKEKSTTQDILSVYIPNQDNELRPLVISLTNPSELFDSYIGLLGHILKDLEVDWQITNMLSTEEIVVTAELKSFLSQVHTTLSKQQKDELMNLHLVKDDKTITNYIEGMVLPYFKEAQNFSTDKVLSTSSEQMFIVFESFSSKDESKNYALVLKGQDNSFQILQIFPDKTYEDYKKGL
jgi:hypothetical protein